MSPEQREERHVAYLAVRRALRTGVLRREPCERCAKPLTHAHHRWGYDQPLAVVWLCPAHHEEEHADMRVIGRQKFYYEPKAWHYSENTGPGGVRTHVERLWDLLTNRERRQLLAFLQGRLAEQTAEPA